MNKLASFWAVVVDNEVIMLFSSFQAAKVFKETLIARREAGEPTWQFCNIKLEEK